MKSPGDGSFTWASYTLLIISVLSLSNIVCKYIILRLAIINLIGRHLVSGYKASNGILGWADNSPLTNNASSTFSLNIISFNDDGLSDVLSTD